MPHEVLVLWGRLPKYEDAAECFQDAGKMFVLAKSFDEAGGLSKSRRNVREDEVRLRHR